MEDQCAFAAIYWVNGVRQINISWCVQLIVWLKAWDVFSCCPWLKGSSAKVPLCQHRLTTIFAGDDLLGCTLTNLNQ
jgi:hypothetical protein